MKTFLFASVLLVFLTGFSFAQFPIAEPGTEGNLVVVTSDEPVIATFQGHSASFSNDLFLELDALGLPNMDGDQTNDLFIFNNQDSPVGSVVDLGSFDIGTELVFRINVNNTGNDFFTGPAERNPDGQFHARVQADWMPNETLVSFEDLFNGPFNFNDLSFSFTNTTSVPEPGATVLAMVCIASLSLSRRKK